MALSLEPLAISRARMDDLETRANVLAVLEAVTSAVYVSNIVIRVASYSMAARVAKTESLTTKRRGKKKKRKIKKRKALA
jgi:hypothetical protein